MIAPRHLLVSLILLTLPAAAETDSQAVCAAAADLTTARELKAARALYESLARTTPRPYCVTTGLDKVRQLEIAAETQWRLAQDLLLDDQRASEARAAMLHALTLDNSRDDIRKQLIEPATTPDQGEGHQDDNSTSDAYAAAEALKGAGYRHEAKAKAKEILTSGADTPPNWVQADWLEEWVPWLEAVAGGLGKLGAVGLAAFALLWILWSLRAKLHATWAWPPPRPCEVVIGDIEDQDSNLQVGKEMRSRIAYELSFASGAPSKITNVSQPGITPIIQSEALPPPISFLGPLLRWIEQTVRYHIAVEVSRPLDGRALVFVRINDHRGRLRGKTAISEPIQSDPRSTYLALATLAGAWAVFEIERLRRPRAKADQLCVLGTSNWRSYGLYRRGADANLPSAARGGRTGDLALFHAALAEDHSNIGALVTVGKAQTRTNQTPNQVAKGIKHLVDARILLEKKPVSGNRWLERLPLLGKIPCFKAYPEARDEPLWYQATYALAIAYLHRFARSEDEPAIPPPPPRIPGDLRQGLRLATELARAIGATQLTMAHPCRRWNIPSRVRGSLQTMLEQDTGYLLGVLAGAIGSAEQIANRLPRRHGRHLGETPAGNTHLDTFGLRWGLPSPPTPWHSQPKLWGWLARIRTNQLPAASAVLDLLVSDEARLGGKFLYNLACACARMQRFDKAYEYIEEFLSHHTGEDRRAEVDRIRKDPSLSPARNALPEKFETLLAEPNGSADPGEGRFELFARPNGKYRFKLMMKKSAETVLTSRVFDTEADAENAIETLRASARDDEHFKCSENCGAFQFTIALPEQTEPVARSKRYATEAGRVAAIEWVLTNAPIASIEPGEADK